MARLQKGDLVKKSTAALLALLAMSASPTFAQIQSDPSTDLSGNGLRPLPQQSIPSAPEADQAPLPGSTGQPSSLDGEPPFDTETGAASPTVPSDSGPDQALANPSGDTGIAPAATSMDTGADLGAPPPGGTTEPAAAAQAEPAATPASAPSADSTTANSDSGSTSGDKTDTKASTDSDGKELAQNSPMPLSAKYRDPAYRSPVRVQGEIKNRRAFKLFASQSLIHNLSFRDTPLREVIAEIARRGNLNILIDRSVISKITGELHDITLNEAMDSILASGGLEHRELDNGTVVVGTPQAMTQLRLNRTLTKAFKLSYADPFDVTNILNLSIFNQGVISELTANQRARISTTSSEKPISKSLEQSERLAGQSKSTNVQQTDISASSDDETGAETQYTTRLDTNKTLRGSFRTNVVEGVGFNSAPTDPGSQQIRSYQTILAELPIDQNGGGAIVIPDTKGRQIFIVGTQHDIDLAEQAIRLIDRRPRQIHIQTSLIELQNAAVRQLGAGLSAQGEGVSTSVLGGSRAPLLNFLPGLGSNPQFITSSDRQVDTAGNIFNTNSINRLTGIPPLPTQYTSQGVLPNGTIRTLSNIIGNVAGTPAGGLNPVTGPPAGAFGGFIGSVLPALQPTIAGTQAAPQSASSLNFLTLSRSAGGRANIATVPTALGLNIDLVLQTNKGKLLANPSVVVSDNTEALISLANEVVHRVTSTVSLGVVSTNVELIRAGIFLDVLARSTEDGFIVMRLRPTVSAPLGPPQTFAGGNVGVTLLNIREVLSQEVRIKDGQTLVLGGLFSEQEAANLSKVPYLAEAPILGAMFRHTLKGRQRSELMLMITPKIVEEQPDTGISEGDSAKTM